MYEVTIKTTNPPGGVRQGRTVSYTPAELRAMIADRLSELGADSWQVAAFTLGVGHARPLAAIADFQTEGWQAILVLSDNVIRNAQPASVLAAIEALGFGEAVFDAPEVEIKVVGATNGE